jgi:hypothetical protein
MASLNNLQLNQSKAGLEEIKYENQMTAEKCYCERNKIRKFENQRRIFENA